MAAFAPALLQWHASHGRHDLPWQQTTNAYRIWISEIMLQQTQVETVIPYFERFMLSFPSLQSLAAADVEAVLTHWSGLGYYARARNLHRAAQVMVEEHGGEFPREFDAILALPGVGRSTAAAISAFAFGERRAILDGNVKRVLARCFGVAGFPGDAIVEKQLWLLAEQLLPADARQVGTYIQAQMDLGATVCVRARPDCAACPLVEQCVAFRTGRVAELPEKKARKPVPSRRTAMLILLSGREVLLERRPASGIWGGLWSFPELDPADDAVGMANIRHGVNGKSEPGWQPIEHGFTHFKLTIELRVIEVTRRQARVTAPGTLWMTLEDARQAAIPTPVRAILDALLKQAE